MLASTCPWPAAAKLAVAFAGTSCRVCSVAPNDHALNHTTAVSERFRYHPSRPLRSLADAVAAAKPDLIIPNDERAVEHLHRLYVRSRSQAVRTLIERSLGRPDSFDQAMSRERLLGVAAEQGVVAPLTAPLHSLADLEAWNDAQPFPWVLKSNGSWGGHGVRIVSSFDEARRAFRDLSRAVDPLRIIRENLVETDAFWLTWWLHQSRPGIIVQSYVEGMPANCAVAAWEGEVVAGLAVEVLSSRGETGPATIVRITNDPAMLDAAARIVASLGLSGFVGFDFAIEAATGRPFLLEMNPRATQICHLRLGLGRDLPGALVARMTGTPAPDEPPVTTSDLVALFPQASVRDYGDVAFGGAVYSDGALTDSRLMRRLSRPRLRVKLKRLFGGAN
jgi:carbamoylphosphate synthase large subunit